MPLPEKVAPRFWLISISEMPGLIVQSGPLVQQVLVGLNRELITAFVLWVAGMPADVFKAGYMTLQIGIQLLPELHILNWLVASLSFPAPIVSFPVWHPVCDSILDVTAVSYDVHSDLPLERL